MVELLLKFIGDFAWLNDVYKTLPSILYAILAAVGGAGIVYSIILGVNLAKSENDEKRRYAAFRLRNTLIGVLVLVVFVIFINLLVPLLVRTIWPLSWDANYQEWLDKNGLKEDIIPETETFIKPALQFVSRFIM